ncbi:MAG: maleylpyruvate isomerase family mycothiol-dependent enzyme [Acidimicrobiaceae bacterium]|nr:maleylpyruvate isomerase family mycothiol-dependent enzyme [Acidimicrobiaceae bacterium]
MDLFAHLAVERGRLADSLDSLTEEEWNSPSLSAGWSTHVVTAHLVSIWEISPAHFGLTLARARSLDRAFDLSARGLAARLSPTQCVDSLRRHAHSRRTPPFLGVHASLTEVLVHGADILWPLGREWRPGVPALAEVLPWLVTRSPRGFLPRERLENLRFDATDLGIEVGTGAPLRGDALSLITLALGRTTRVELVTGEGRDLLLERLR